MKPSTKRKKKQLVITCQDILTMTEVLNHMMIVGVAVILVFLNFQRKKYIYNLLSERVKQRSNKARTNRGSKTSRKCENYPQELSRKQG